jgi:hypothetical protein
MILAEIWRKNIGKGKDEDDEWVTMCNKHTALPASGKRKRIERKNTYTRSPGESSV